MKKLKLNTLKIYFNSTKLLSKKGREEKSSFHISGDSITFLSGDFTEKMKAKTTSIVTRRTIITFLSGMLFIEII